MKTKAPTNAREYLLAARGWETDEIMRSAKNERRAWLVAGVAVVLAILSVIAVVLLTPLKTVEPFVVRVDKNTGVTDVVSVLNQHTITYNEAIDKYFLAQYVRYCESYSADTVYPDYQSCVALSSPEVGKAEFAAISPSNPKSPTKLYGERGRVEIDVNSISFLSQGMAQVRYTRQVITGNGRDDSQWIATVVYTYLNPPTDERTRLVNPVGFQVAQFRQDPVVVPTSNGGMTGPTAKAPTPAPVAQPVGGAQ